MIRLEVHRIRKEKKNSSLQKTYQFGGNGLLSAPECNPERAVALCVRHAQINAHFTEFVSHSFQLVTNGNQKIRLILWSSVK